MHYNRIHITGGAASGKTWLADRIGLELGVEPVHLDLEVVDFESRNKSHKSRMMKPVEARRELIGAIVARERWVTEGAYFDWAEPLYPAADLIIHLEVPWRIASYRIIARHLKAELRRDNRFPGWRRLYRFWSWNRLFYLNRREDGLDGSTGAPMTARSIHALLQPYIQKVRICRSGRDVEPLLRDRASSKGTA